VNLRAFGKTGMNVSELGYGTSEIGFRPVTQAEVDELLNAALDAGLNIIDTAECYNDSEEKIGRAVSHRRSEFFLFTKCGHASGMEGPDWDPAMLEKQIDRSLVRLKTDVVDLVQLHSCSLEILQQGDVIEVLERAKAAGKTRFIGYSGDNDAAEYAVTCGRFDSLQTSVNVMDQSVIDQVLPAAEKAGLGVIAKRPIANAVFVAEPPEGAYGRPYWERWLQLQYPELQGEPKEAVGKALKFTLSQPALCTVIVGSSTKNRFRSNLEILETVDVTPEEITSIRNRWREVAPPDWIGLT